MTRDFWMGLRCWLGVVAWCGSSYCADAPVAPPPGDCGTVDEPECSLFWLPLGSFVLPGLGQAVDGRTWWPYSAAGALGVGGTVYVGTQFGSQIDASSPVSLSRPEQALEASFSLYLDAAGLSLYETYRHRVVERMGFRSERFRPAHELLLGPVHFESLTHWPVIVELLVAGGLTGLKLASDDHDFAGIKLRDAGTILFSSASAGVWEEAAYRGWLMSYLEHRWEWNRWLANGFQAVVFGVSHGKFDGRILFGFFDGWMAQANDYDLMDNVFAHTWWDIMVFSAEFAIGRYPREAMIVLPPIPF